MLRLASRIGMVCVVVGLVGSNGPLLGASWESVAPLNTPRAQHRAELSDSGYIYAIGGHDVVSAIGSVERYDPNDPNAGWVFVSSMTTARGGPGTVKVGGVIYVIGGYDGSVVVGTMETYDEPNDTWVLSPYALNVPRQNFGAEADHTGKIYAFGGYDTNAQMLASVEVFDANDPNAGWQMLGYNLSEPRVYHGSGIDGLGRIYAIAGSTASQVFGTTSVERFDPSNPNAGWDANAPAVSRKGHVGADVSAPWGSIYILGGWSGWSHYSRVEVYDVQTDSWSDLPSMMRSINNFAAAFDPSLRLYAIGGEHFDRQEEVERMIGLLTLTLTVRHPERGGVIVEPNLPYYEPNTTVTLTAYLIEEGMYWSGWEGDVPEGHELDNPLTITMDSPKAITTRFKCGVGVGPMLPMIGIGLLGMYVIRRRKA